MKTCLLCGKSTQGSIGAAGYFWPFICQPCKDEEDKALRDRLERLADTLGLIKEGVGHAER